MVHSVACSDLTSQVLSFQRTGAGYTSLVTTVSLYCYHYPRWRYRWSNDECSDFYVYFYPKMVRMLSDFTDVGKPFESYLVSVLRWQLRVFANLKRQREVEWNLSRSNELWEECADIVTDHGSCAPQPQDDIPSRTDGGVVFKKRLLLAALKQVSDLGDREITRLAAVTGYEQTWIADIVSQLRDNLQSKQEKLRLIRQRRNAAFCRVRMLEQQLAGEVETDRCRRLTEKLRRARRAMANATSSIQRLKLSPSNRQIAQALGVPKGTVDSALYWLKRKASTLYTVQTGHA